MLNINYIILHYNYFQFNSVINNYPHFIIEIHYEAIINLHQAI